MEEFSKNGNSLLLGNSQTTCCSEPGNSQRLDMNATEQKYHYLQSILLSYPNILIAYSGGVDSTFLLKVAVDVLGQNARGIIGVSPSLPRQELEEALHIAREFSLPVDTIETHEMEDPRYTGNPRNRCYFCKKELFGEIYEYARRHGFRIIADGTNADDGFDFRPGMQAAREFSVCSPLAEAQLTKTEIRRLSRQLGLPTWNKPEMACLSSRLPTGTTITVERLKQVERAEAFLRKLGFSQLRVRYHGSLARIEVEKEEIPRLLQPETREQVDNHLKSLGFTHVAVDLAGYHRGSLNATATEKDAIESDRVVL